VVVGVTYVAAEVTGEVVVGLTLCGCPVDEGGKGSPLGTIYPVIPAKAGIHLEP